MSGNVSSATYQQLRPSTRFDGTIGATAGVFGEVIGPVLRGVPSGATAGLLTTATTLNRGDNGKTFIVQSSCVITLGSDCMIPGFKVRFIKNTQANFYFEVKTHNVIATMYGLVKVHLNLASPVRTEMVYASPSDSRLLMGSTAIAATVDVECVDVSVDTNRVAYAVTGDCILASATNTTEFSN